MFKRRLATLAAACALTLVVGVQAGCSNSDESAPAKPAADCQHGGEHKWKTAASGELRCEVCGVYKAQSTKQ